MAYDDIETALLPTQGTRDPTPLFAHRNAPGVLSRLSDHRTVERPWHVQIGPACPIPNRLNTRRPCGEFSRANRPPTPSAHTLLWGLARSDRRLQVAKKRAPIRPITMILSARAHQVKPIPPGRVAPTPLVEATRLPPPQKPQRLPTQMNLSIRPSSQSDSASGAGLVT